ncbi:MAG: hypothetical protein JWM23_1320 [Microbacteriaceae bacterium]|nr:hypothetical protein [Microbacteriaceae bacterium]
MGWHKLLLTVVALSTLWLSPISDAAGTPLPASACFGWGASQGSCGQPPPATGTINNGGVDLSAGYESGAGSNANNSNANDSNATDPEEGRAADPQAVARGIPGSGPVPFATQSYTVNCTPGSPCDPNLVVRISDLVSFTPATSASAMEPFGWTVVGLPTNFFASASVHTRSGLLLGFPAEVRFTPVGYRWDYGDGSARNSTSGGETWATLGLPEFSETATSHSFRDRATRVITLTVSYGAEYRFASQGWRSISGTLAVPADPLTAVVGDAHTVLIDRDCLRGPHGPGC